MRYTSILCVSVAACLSWPVVWSAAAYADLGDQLFKLLAKDGAAEDFFGVSVAICGPPGNEVAIIGAAGDDDNGSFSGSAYLFDTATGRQIAKLLPNDGAEGDHFGWSVAISGATAIVGARQHEDNGFQSGSAYLFDTTTGQQLFKLLPNDGAAVDRFGESVAISGTPGKETAIVGAWGDDDNGLESGSAYLFYLSDPTNPVQIAKLLANDGAADDRFGYSVAISGPTAIVGARRDDDNGDNSGSAYLFCLSDPTNPVQIAKLLPDDGAEFDDFGFSVAISGATAIVGTPKDDDNGNNSGSAYLFDTTTGKQLFKLLPDDGAASDHFGVSVAISPDSIGTAIVGAHVDDNDNGNNSGSAYLFDTTTGRQIAKLLASDGAVADVFGWSVAISGTPGKETAIVGAWGDDDNGDDSGSAYLFDAGAPGTCPWDVNGDGVVNHHDILEVVHNLGLCDDPDNCPWDVNGDGIVNGRDVAAVATHFGLCP